MEASADPWPIPVPALARLLGADIVRGGPTFAPVRNPVIDSREAGTGDVFFALAGEQVDGHDYLSDAVERGASALVVSDAARALAAGGTPAILEVPDVLQALARAGTARLAALSAVTVGITGSVGKTTTKDLVAHLLSTRFSVGKSEKNKNTETGLPLSILTLDRKIDYFVAELGMSRLGEIAELCEIVHPRIGVLLNVGRAHIGLLGSVENIASAKGELLESLPADGVAVCNADDALATAQAARSRAPVTWFGTGECDVRGSAFTCPDGKLGIEMTASGTTVRCTTNLLGSHYLANVCAATAVALSCGIPLSVVEYALPSFFPPEHRGEIYETARGALVIDDAYNSSPTALAASLASLSPYPRLERIAVIGDMLELGTFAESEHREAGRLAGTYATVLVAIGEHADDVASGARETGLALRAIHTFPDVEAAKPFVDNANRKGTVFLLKGSHGVHLELLLPLLERANP